MIDLNSAIQRIRFLLQEGTDQSITYAALEARLALERVCYDRLRQRHDYISHDQLKKWQPGALVNTLIRDVDEYLGKTLVLSISKSPSESGAVLDDEDYVEVGTEIGFNPKLVARLWNALSKLALHAHLPEHKSADIPDYGNRERVRSKVNEVLAELERLSKGTMTFSGLGAEVKFHCTCGELNRRRAALLRDGQYVHCFNPECKQTWKVVHEDDGISFEQVTIPVACENCHLPNYIPWRFFLDMKHDELGAFSCHSCNHKNFVQWRLMQVQPQDTKPKADAT